MDMTKKDICADARTSFTGDSARRACSEGYARLPVRWNDTLMNASTSLRRGFVGLCFASSTHLCYDKSRNERTDFSGRFWQGQLLPYAPQADSALYANLVKPLFARF